MIFAFQNHYRSILFVFLFAVNLQAQVFTSSNLPIVIINTDSNQSIVDEPRVLANMKIIKHPDGSQNYMTDQNTAAFLNYDGRISIEIRGSSSQSLPKKGYGLTTLLEDNISNNNVKLLGMPSENDWVLNGLAFDPSLIRDYLSYNLSTQLGNYAPRTVYCEVVINGDYQGLYLLQEKIKIDSNRVNILKMTETDNATPAITGGYIIKADKTTGGDPVAWNMSSYAGSTSFIHDSPNPETVTTQQFTYIRSQFTTLGSTSHTNNTSLTSGYPNIIDVPSFVDFMIINELASNADGYQLSTYFHKDRNGKLRAGPVWDFNLTYGNDLFAMGFDRSKTNVWQLSNGDNEGAKFWRDLFDEPNYRCYLSKRWNALTQTGQPLKYENLTAFIDQTMILISEAKVREHQKWGTVPNQTAEINAMKTFLNQRIAWINANIGSFSACNTVTTPPLVITKINYNPETSAEFPVSNDLEFIEIKNAGTTTVDLTGIYFKELGISYKFPANATVNAGQSFYLASNPTVFQSKYGITSFGQFTRNLSNSSQQLVLADAFGNTIDTVQYDDESPWPDADGNGSFLQLISTSLDNALPSSWMAESTEMLVSSAFSNGLKFIAYPNPVSRMLTIESQTSLREVTVFNVLGNRIFQSNENSKTANIDFSSFTSGIYFVKIENETGASIQKIIRQ